MSYEFYKVLHFTGLFMVFAAQGAAILLALNAGSKNFANRKFLAMVSGIGLLVAFVSGFGLMAKLGLMRNSWPTWIFGMIAVWIALGALPILAYRKPKLGKLWWLVLIALGVLAACFARYKPM
jgi:uncharacterized membrane protein SirB2